MNGLVGSAICSFSLDSIQEVFNGKFKDQATSSSAWLPVLSSKVPEPRPGSCSNDSQSLGDPVLNFIRGHPLMDSAVPQDNGKPVFYKRDIVFTKIVVDLLTINGNSYTVYYAGTSTGSIYKLVEWIDRRNEVHSNLLDIIDVTTPEPIRGMVISPKHKSLYVSSDSHIRQIDLYSCRSRYDTCVRCTRDPYCGWDRTHNECKSSASSQGYVPCAALSLSPVHCLCRVSLSLTNHLLCLYPVVYRLLKNIENSSPNMCDGSVKQKDLKINYGQSVHLSCPLHTFDYDTSQSTKHSSSSNVKWFYYRNERSTGIEVISRKDKYIFTSDQGLVILATTDREAGRYECKLTNISLIRYDVFVDPSKWTFTVDVHRPSRATLFTHSFSFSLSCRILHCDK